MTKNLVIAKPDQLIAEAKANIMKVKYYKTGKTDKFGKIVGYHEYQADKLPFEHQEYHLDKDGLCIYFEKFVKEYSKPSMRIFHYKEWQVWQGIWIDRYGDIENYHRYEYDNATGLLIWRAEYDYQGKLYYSIRSRYDDAKQHVEDAWYDANDRLLKRLEYKNDDSGEPLEQREYGESGALVGSLRFKYDKKGNVVERAWHNATGNRMSRFSYGYDPRDNLIRVDLRGLKDKLEAKQEFTYDAIGNTVSEKWYDQQGKLYKDLRFEGMPKVKVG